MPDFTFDKRFFMQDRELSWLRFNERVLEEARDTSVPVLERLKFISIFISNLDEFFMIRVGSIFELYSTGEKAKDRRSGLTAEEELNEIYKEVARLYDQKTITYNSVKEDLKKENIFSLNYNELTSEEKKYIKVYFKENIKPILSPQIVGAHHPFPHIQNKEIHIACLLKGKDKPILGLIPMPKMKSDIIILPNTNELRFIRIEKVIYEHSQDVFSKYEILDKNTFCVTRNSDINVDDEMLSEGESEDFKAQMKKVLKKRKRLAVVRLEANYSFSQELEKMFCEKFNIKKHQIYVSNTAMNMGYAFELMGKIKPEQITKLLDKEYKAPLTAQIDHSKSIIKQIEKKDLLLHYPYESMDTFLQLLKEAAYDKNVVSIKITIYRLASRAKVVEYLCAAAENGKEVTALMELRARFDEQNNIDWSERLEEAGCRVLYGIDDYKTHSKLCLITYQDKNEIKYITQVATGNYNEKTAKIYTDLSLITADKTIGRDSVEFFKNMSIGSVTGVSEDLLIAPEGLKPKLLDKINKEREKGEKGRIIIKMNSLTDTDFIYALVLAQSMGVRITLIIRGICCIIPGVKGITDNIEVISVVGRYLEHSRIFSFGEGQEQEIYISSADLMTRNTQRRVEVACPIKDIDVKKEINHILEITQKDNVKARLLQSNGVYIKKPDIGEKLNSQEYFMEYYTNKNKIVTKEKKPSLLVNIKNKIKEIFE